MKMPLRLLECAYSPGARPAKPEPHPKKGDFPSGWISILSACCSACGNLKPPRGSRFRSPRWSKFVASSASHAGPTIVLAAGSATHGSNPTPTNRTPLQLTYPSRPCCALDQKIRTPVRAWATRTRQTQTQAPARCTIARTPSSGRPLRASPPATVKVRACRNYRHRRTLPRLWPWRTTTPRRSTSQCPRRYHPWCWTLTMMISGG